MPSFIALGLFCIKLCSLTLVCSCAKFTVMGGGGVQTSYHVTPTWDWIGLNWVEIWVELSQNFFPNIGLSSQH